MIEQPSKIRLQFIELSILLMFSSLILLSGFNFHYNSIQNMYSNKIQKSITHSPISIIGDDALSIFCSGNGSGTLQDPYIIRNLTIDSHGSDTSCIYIQDTTKYLVIDNCTAFNVISGYTGRGAGIFLENCSNCNITNNVIHYCFMDGMIIENCKNITIRHNNCFDNEIALGTLGTVNLTILSNKISNNTYGLACFSCIAAKFDYNNFTNHRYGMVLFSGTNESIISNNIFRNINDTSISLPGIYGSNYNDKIEYNKIYGDKGILLESAINITIKNNIMIDGGLQLQGTQFAHFASHHVDDSNVVNVNKLIYRVNATNLPDSTFSNAGQVILVNCKSSKIENQNLSNTPIGIHLYKTTNMTIIKDVVENCSIAGIKIENSSTNIIDSNGIKNNTIGVHFIQASQYNTIENNSISRNIDGLRIEDNASFGNLLFLNKFTNGTKHAFDYGENSWDNGTCGNYWSDYLTKYPMAKNNNRTWDTPYMINMTSGSIDHHPLVYPYFELNKTPIADFRVNVTTIIEGQSIEFAFNGSQGNRPATFQWNFGDGSSNSSDRNPTHRYKVSGNYTVKLTVKDIDGNSSMKIRINYITVVVDILPIASFSTNATSIIVGNSIQFTFTGSTGNSPASFSWDFGDNSSASILESPSHTYTIAGNFTVRLTVIDGNKNASISTKQIQVRVPLQAPGVFALSSDAGVPDNDGLFILSWTPSVRAANYSIYIHSSPITKLNGSILKFASGVMNNSYRVAISTNGTYYFIVVAFNDAGNATSNCLSVTMQIPGERPANGNPIMQFLNEYGIFMGLGITGIVIISAVSFSRHIRAKKRKLN